MFFPSVATLSGVHRHSGCCVCGKGKVICEWPCEQRKVVCWCRRVLASNLFSEVSMRVGLFCTLLE